MITEMDKKNKNYIIRDLSWLSFNARVLQEAIDKNVPLIERIKFLGIYSSNLDEYFRVRVATLKRMVGLGKKAKMLLGSNAETVLDSIQKIVKKQARLFDRIYNDILKELAKDKIYIINEKELNYEQGIFVRSYFHQEVRPTLMPIMIDQVPEFPHLKDHSISLAVDLSGNQSTKDIKCAMIEIPTEVIPRFLVLPQIDDKKFIILLDDVIRYCLKDIFPLFNLPALEAYTIKLTRDAELDIDNIPSVSFIEKISKSIKKRKSGTPVRFIYDAAIPKQLLLFLKKKLDIRDNDNLIPASRYHNFKDFMNFPKIGPSEFLYDVSPPLPNPAIDLKKSLFDTIRKKDIMLHYPYQSFHYMIDLLREASIDPDVKSIKMTLYRVAKYSNVVNALINAVKNGKAVTVVVELQARFDEEANIYWTQKLEEEGAKVITGVTGLKVHSKLCEITRRESGKWVRYVHIGTGNFNEVTAKLYCDDSLFTADKRITNEVSKVFGFFENNINVGKYKHLLVSPFNMRKKYLKLLDYEIHNAKKGKEAYCIIKTNSLSDQVMIDKIYEACQAGVKIQMIIRGICSLIPGIEGVSEKIEAVSIVDKYLEHSRIFIFCHGGKEMFYISSADWMTRNLDFRNEVACPIYDKDIQNELREIIRIQLRDNTKARYINGEQNNRYRRKSSKQKVRAQIEIYNMLQKKVTG